MEEPIPGLVELANEAGLQTAFFYSWEKLRYLSQPGNLSYSFFIDEKYDLPDGDKTVLSEAIRYLNTYPADFLFVYFGTMDTMGEELGWMTTQYYEQLEIVDSMIGELLNVLPQEATALILADHGGHDFGHGTDLPEDMTIPWLIAGPGIRQDHEIRSEVSLMDTAPTLARVMGIEPHPKWMGRCINEAFE
jgi:predicted AlkP superfamily pyrophosphatase or phosphodiesterase